MASYVCGLWEMHAIPTRVALLMGEEGGHARYQVMRWSGVASLRARGPRDNMKLTDAVSQTWVDNPSNTDEHASLQTHSSHAGTRISYLLAALALRHATAVRMQAYIHTHARCR